MIQKPAPLSSLTGAQKAKGVAYANKYWDNYNGAYRSYPQDCTNFVSQAMLEAGWPEVSHVDLHDCQRADAWWYGGIPDVTGPRASPTP